MEGGGIAGCGLHKVGVRKGTVRGDAQAGSKGLEEAAVQSPRQSSSHAGATVEASARRTWGRVAGGASAHPSLPGTFLVLS